MNTPTTPQPNNREALFNIVLIVATIGIAYFISVTLGLDRIRESVAAAGVWAPFIVILLKATTIVVAPLGGTIIYPLAGALFGFWQGLLLTLIGDALGSSIAFFISRYLGRSVLHFFTSQSQRPMVDQVVTELGEKWSFIKARIFFAGFMDLFAYAAGLTTISYWFFILVHMAVHTPVVVLYVAFGELIVSGEWWLVIPLGFGSAALALFGAWRFKLDLAKSN